MIHQADTGRSLSVGFGGRGLLFPLRRDSSGFVSGTGAELTRAAVGLTLGTIAGSAQSHGELPWRTEFGSLLNLLRMRANSPALAALAKTRVADALATWVPNVRLTRVEVSSRGQQLLVSISYGALDSSGTKVLVPGLETSVALG